MWQNVAVPADFLVTSASALTTAAFVAFTAALVALWVARASAPRAVQHLWVGAGVLSIILALADRVLDLTGLAALAVFAAVCVLGRRATPTFAKAPVDRHPATAIITHALLVLGCAALFVHLVPGFQNPILVADVVLGPGAQPYTKYLNYDKGMAALLLLGLYAREQTATDRAASPVAFLWRFAVLVTTMLVLTMLAGYVRWDPKLPAWWPSWAWSMVFLTALPEEALFRGCLQNWIEKGLGSSRRATVWSVLLAGVVFGIAHAGGGVTYGLLSSVAGIGYGWIYASTRSLGAATLAHAGLNTVHFLFFTYPAVQRLAT